MELQNAYIAVLRCGTENDQVNPQTLVDYLNEQKIYFYTNHPSDINTTAFKTTFRNNFIGGDGKYPESDLNQIYYLKPDARAFLLSYDALTQAKESAAQSQRSAKSAIRIATVSIWLTAIFSLVQIVLSVVGGVK